MPVVGVNVLENPDWTEGDNGTENWLTCRSFDPLLCWGTQGHLFGHSFEEVAGLDVLGTNSLEVTWGHSTQLDPIYGYPGLIYAGEGFDGSPGDSWRVAFDADRTSFTANYAGIPSTSYGPGSDVFVRVGIAVKVGDTWVGYYMNLPSSSVAGGGSLAYDETFEIPSDWPEGQYHFAICHTGTPALPTNSPPSGTTTYTWGFRLVLANAWLSYEGGGAGSPGSAGVAHPYLNWPLPRWQAGYPTPCPECCGVIEWDQFENADPMANVIATIAPLANTPFTGPVTTGRYQTYLWSASLPDPDDDADTAEYGSVIAGNGSLGPSCLGAGSGPTAGTEVGWFSCGNFCSFLSMDYVAVPLREYVKYLFGTPSWFEVPAFVPHLVHPSCLGGLNGPAQPGLIEVVPAPSDHTAMFCWPDCVPIEPLPPVTEPLYLTRRTAPGDPNIPAGGGGGLNLRGARAAPGEPGVGGTGSGGYSLGHIKGQP